MAKQKLTSEEQKALEAFRALYATNPGAITSDMGTALFRNLASPVRDKIKSYFSGDEKAAYNKWIKEYKRLPAGQQTTTGHTPTPGQLGQTQGSSIDLSIPGSPENMNGIVTALTRPWLDSQDAYLKDWYATQDRMNRPNLYGPLGQTTYAYNPTTGRFEQTTTAAPEQQALLNAETATDTQAAQTAKDYLARVKAAAGNDYSTDRQAATDRVYERWRKVNEPAFAKQMQDFEQNMANRGIVPGSDQYNREKDLLMKSQQDQRDAALTGASQEGRTEQLHGLEVSQNRPAQIAANLLAMGQGPKLPDAPTPTNVDTNYINSIDTALKGVDQILNSDQFTAEIRQKAEELARRYKLDKYQVYETLKLQYKQLLSQQAIANINANAQLGSAAMAADATKTSAQIAADSAERINRDNINADREAQNNQNGGGSGSGVTNDLVTGASEGIGAGVRAAPKFGSQPVAQTAQRPLASPTGSILSPQNSVNPQQQTVTKRTTAGLRGLGFGAGSSIFGSRRGVFG